MKKTAKRVLATIRGTTQAEVDELHRHIHVYMSARSHKLDKPTRFETQELIRLQTLAARAAQTILKLPRPSKWKVFQIMECFPHLRAQAFNVIVKCYGEEGVRETLKKFRLWNIPMGKDGGIRWPRKVAFEPGPFRLDFAAARWLIDYSQEIGVLTNVAAYVPELADEAEIKKYKLLNAKSQVRHVGVAVLQPIRLSNG